MRFNIRQPNVVRALLGAHNGVVAALEIEQYTMMAVTPAARISPKVIFSRGRA